MGIMCVTTPLCNLPKDRILSTDVDASWTFDPTQIATLDDILSQPKLFDTTYNTARDVTLELFCKENSPSVQSTMYNMSHKILETVKQVGTVSYVLPNKHYILFNLEWKGIKDNKDLFYPAPDPNGLIKSTVGRKGDKAKF